MIPLDRPGWKTTLSWVASILLALLFLASGVWKITDAHGAAMRMAQAGVPQSLSLAAALLFGIVETVAGVLVVTPRFRRWGAIITGLLLIAFMGYFAVQYNVLRGADCSCFPWVKRVVGPSFFIGDALMLALALIAARWSRPSGGFRSAVLVLGVVVVFALVSYGVAEASRLGTRAPATVTVEGQPYSLQRGKVFLYFFNPECMHCFAAAQRMAQARWLGARVVAVPVEQPQYARQFLTDTGLNAAVTTDFPTLKQVFGYSTYPWGVAVEDGREKALVTRFDGDEPVATLRRLGFVE